MTTKVRKSSTYPPYTINRAKLCDHLLTNGDGLMSKVVDRIIRFHKYRISPLLIVGEPGSGKEYVARALQSDGKYLKPKEFFAVNCAVSNRELLQSLLFGHLKGAFTGAFNDRKGILRKAKEKGVFLDEIDKSDTDLQASLLRYLRTGEIETLGADEFDVHKTQVVFGSSVKTEVLLAEWKAQLVEARISNLNGGQLSEIFRKAAKAEKESIFKNDFDSGGFLPDFLNRVTPFMIVMPPLRERRKDLSKLVPYFIEKACREFNRTIEKVEAELLHFFILYNWPGNIAEVENFTRAGVVFSDGRLLSLKACLEVYAGKHKATQLLLIDEQGDNYPKSAYPELTLQYLRIPQASYYAAHFYEDDPNALGWPFLMGKRKRDAPTISIKKVGRVIKNLHYLRLLECYDDVELILSHKMNKPNREKIGKYIKLRSKLEKLGDIQQRMGFKNRPSFNKWRKDNFVDAC